MTNKSIVDEVADHIAVQIASGRLQPGERLPSIRRLAAEHDINPSTVRLILGKLGTAGFVEPRHGVGVVVSDIHLYGGVETWRYLIRLSPKLPDLVVQTVQDVLETLHVFYAAAISKIAVDPKAYDPTPVRRAQQRLQVMAARGDADPADTHKCVLQILRTGHAAVGGGVALAILNSLGAALAEVPDALNALYADPGAHAWWWDQVLTAWESGEVGGARQALTLLDDFHAQTLEHLRTLLDTAPRAAFSPWNRS